LLQGNGGRPQEISLECFLDADADQHAIQITRVDHRSTVYQKLRPRQDKVYGLL